MIAVAAKLGSGSSCRCSFLCRAIGFGLRSFFPLGLGLGELPFLCC
jgi:hypothetical protein